MLYLMTMENTGIDETTAAVGNAYTEKFKRKLRKLLCLHASGMSSIFVRACNRSLGQLKASVVKCLAHSPVTIPCKESLYAIAPVIPTAKKTKIHPVVEIQSVRLTLTPGLFSF